MQVEKEVRRQVVGRSQDIKDCIHPAKELNRVL